MVEIGDKGILFPVGNKKGNVMVMGAGTPEVGDKVVVAPLGNMKGDLVAWKPGTPEVGDKALLLPSYGMKEYVLAIREEEDELKEGDYTTWTHKWTNDIPNGLYTRYISFLIDERSDVLILAWRDNSYKNRFGIYNLSDFSVVFESGSGSDYTYTYSDTGSKQGMSLGNVRLNDGGISRSLQSYILFLTDWHVIEVWRGGSNLLWTHDIHDVLADTEIEFGEISLTGKWIFLVDGYNDKFFLYEGS